MTTLASLRAVLDSADPRLWPALLALVAFGVVYAWRRWHLASFDRLPRAVQGLPALILTAGLAAGASGADVTGAVLDAVLGALSGLTAVGAHHVLRALPGPYGGKRS